MRTISDEIRERAELLPIDRLVVTEDAGPELSTNAPDLMWGEPTNLAPFQAAGVMDRIRNDVWWDRLRSPEQVMEELSQRVRDNSYATPPLTVIGARINDEIQAWGTGMERTLNLPHPIMPERPDHYRVGAGQCACGYTSMFQTDMNAHFEVENSTGHFRADGAPRDEAVCVKCGDLASCHTVLEAMPNRSGDGPSISTNLGRWCGRCVRSRMRERTSNRLTGGHALRTTAIDDIDFQAGD